MSDNDNQKIYDRFNDDVQYMIVYAKAASINAKVEYIYPESFVIGLLTMGINDVSKALVKHNIDLEQCLKTFKDKLEGLKSKKVNGSVNNYDNIRPNKVVKEICQFACSIGDELKHDNVGVQHVFLSILQTCPDIQKIFEEKGLQIPEFSADMRKIVEVKPNKDTKSKHATKRKNGSALEVFCVDMTKEAEENKYDPIISRDSEIEEAITILCRRNKSNPILVGEPGVGKCLAWGTKIRMFDGTVKFVQDVEVGDQLMGVDSAPRNVLSLGNGVDEMFTIEQKRGDNYTVNEDHILSLVRNRNGVSEFTEITVRDWFKQSATFKERWKGWKVGVDYTASPVIVDPYMLGLWLGDGTTKKAQVTNIDVEIVRYLEYFAFINRLNVSQDKISYSFSNQEKDIIAAIDEMGDIVATFSTVLDAHDFARPTDERKRRIHSTIYDCLNGKQTMAYGYKWTKLYSKQASLYTSLKEIGVLGNKNIPATYKYNSLEVRLNVLAGLIDADGYLINNCYEISQKNKKLAKDIMELSRSLGFYCSWKEKIVGGTTHYRMNICGQIDLIPCKIVRKKPKIIRKNKNHLVTGIDIKPVGLGEYFGFEIDGDGLFLLEDFTVTHNTAIVEGICQRIISKTVPKKLRESKIYSLNVGVLVAGTKYRGEFENRLQAIIKELKENPNYIIFIDEIHNVVGAGSASGSVDAANMLKPALAKGLKCLGATTNAEHKKIFSGDGALDRRFEKISVEEPSAEDTMRILRGIKSRLEEYHKCIVTEDAMETSVKLTKRYKPEKFFPDKAITCIDTACAKYAWKDEDDCQIVGHDIAMVISKQCKIPLEIILWDNYERVQNTENALRKNIVGQDHVIEAISRVLKNSYSGVRNPEKPIGVFVMGGESGTGKTHTAKELSKVLFDNDASFIRIDMSEYSESHSVSKITGSPPGYVGFQDADVIGDKIKNRPYCVLLLDEIEKAHPNTIRLFLQVMGEGFFTDSSGDKINCKNVIMIMTGNFGMHDKQNSKIGFGQESHKNAVDKEKERLISFCKKAYGVEFVNRVDDFLPFLPIDKKSLEIISLLEIEKFVKRIERKDCVIEFTDAVAKQMVKLSEVEHGINAMILDRLVSKYLEPCLADIFLKLENKPDICYTVTIDVKNDKFVARKAKRKCSIN